MIINILHDEYFKTQTAEAISNTKEDQVLTKVCLSQCQEWTVCYWIFNA